jgi:malate dehydrogenase
MTFSMYVLFNPSVRFILNFFLRLLFFCQTNASIVRDLASAVARVSPTAIILVISNPVNSTVPIVAATLEKAGVFDPAHVFGVTTLDVVRATRFLAGIASAPPTDTPVAVIGGHSGATIVPLLSQSKYGKAVTGEVYEKLVHRIQFGGDEVVKAKDGAGSATLSMAFAGAKFTNSILRGLNGEKGVITPTFVKSPLFAAQGIDFFSSNVEVGVRVKTIRLDIPLLNIKLSRLMALKRFTPSAPSPLRRRNYLMPAYPNLRKT